MPWAVPYLPIDPKDVGRTYEAVIRVNSQSGKGGVAYLMKTEHQLDLPRRLQIEFSRVIQARTDAQGGEVTPEQIWEVFSDEYLPATGTAARVRFELAATSVVSDAGRARALERDLRRRGSRTCAGRGNGPIAAFCDALAPGGPTSGCWTTPSTRCPPAATPGPRPTSSARSAGRFCGASASTHNITHRLAARRGLRRQPGLPHRLSRPFPPPPAPLATIMDFRAVPLGVSRGFAMIDGESP